MARRISGSLSRSANRFQSLPACNASGLDLTRRRGVDDEQFRTRNDFALAIPRLILGIVFFAHGAQKMLGWFGGSGFNGTMGYFESQGIPAIFAFLAIAAEFFGSLGLIAGFLGRIAAFGISVNMLVAIAMIHAHNGFFMNWLGNQKGEGFEYHLLVLGIAAMVMIAGSGAASLDWVIYKNKSYKPV